MKIDILTLFPEMFKGPFDKSIIKRAQDKKLVEIKIHNLRKWTKDKHKTVDDRPYGGGPGMILMIKPIYEALKELKEQAVSKSEDGRTSKKKKPPTKIILLTPQGKVFNQKMAKRLVKEKHLILICGHYEGIDERVRQYLVDEEISIGDYILTGGELPAAVIIDVLTRLIPGVLEKEEAIQRESFTQSSLEYPQYTRPANFQGWKVPEVLLSGNHQKIKNWQQKKSLIRTKARRPDLIKSVSK